MAFKNIKKTQGKDFNFYNSTSVSWAQFGASDGYTTLDGYGPDLVITFPTQGIRFTAETVGQIVEYSFNGSTVHGVLDGTATSTTRVINFDNRQQSLIWFRLRVGSAGPAVVTVTAWGIR